MEGVSRFPRLERSADVLRHLKTPLAALGRFLRAPYRLAQASGFLEDPGPSGGALRQKQCRPRHARRERARALRVRHLCGGLQRNRVLPEDRALLAQAARERAAARGRHPQRESEQLDRIAQAQQRRRDRELEAQGRGTRSKERVDTSNRRRRTGRRRRRTSPTRTGIGSAASVRPIWRRRSGNTRRCCRCTRGRRTRSSGRGRR